MAKKKSKQLATPEPSRMATSKLQPFIVVTKAMVEITIKAKSSKAAVAEYNRQFKRKARYGKRGFRVQLLAGNAVVVDPRDGEVALPATDSTAKTAAEKWNAPTLEQAAKRTQPLIKYMDNKGQVIAITRARTGKWSVSRAGRRLQHPSLPLRQTAEQCQADLDAYAAKRGWASV